MLRLVKFLVFIGLVFMIVDYATRPQPLRYDVHLVYLKDTVVYGYHKLRSPAHQIEIEKLQAMADAGNLRAQVVMGESFFAQGAMDPKNYEKAVDYLKLAADEGLPTAQNVLGVAYRKGLGIKKSSVKAYKWFKLSADAGYGLAKKNLMDLSSQITKEQVAAGIEQSDLWMQNYMMKQPEMNVSSLIGL